MNETHIKTGQNDMTTLAKDARSLINATTEAASQKFGKPASGLPKKWKAPRKPRAAFATRRKIMPKPLMRRCVSILIKP